MFIVGTLVSCYNSVSGGECHEFGVSVIVGLHLGLVVSYVQTDVRMDR